MIISRKKYEKLNDDLIDAKAKVDDAKKTLDEENKIMRATLLIKKQRDQYKAECERLERENAEQLALLKEFRKLIDYKLTLHQGSSMYREYRSKLDQLGVK